MCIGSVMNLSFGIESIPKIGLKWIHTIMILTRIKIDLYYVCYYQLNGIIGLKQNIPKAYNEDDTLHTRLNPKEHSPFILEHCLVTKPCQVSTVSDGLNQFLRAFSGLTDYLFCTDVRTGNSPDYRPAG
jgi:hypothetical protein